MPIDITIPRLGWTMDEGVFVGWLKNDGDLVKAGDPLFSLENDKAVQEVESLDSGLLRILPGGPQAGATVAVGTVIGTLLQPGEEAVPTAPGPAPDAPGLRETAPPGAGVRSSPRARRRARAMGIDWTTLAGSGKSGRVRERDVLAAASALDASAPAPVSVPALSDEFDVRPIDPTRRLIAERMVRSSRETAAVTLTTSIDATNLVNLRRQFAAVAGQKGESAPAIGYVDVVIKLAALALQDHPLLNARWENGRIEVPRGIHVGLAVDTAAGLLVPVVRDVPKLTLRQVSARVRDLVARAARRTLTVEELTGGTFTVTNLGPLGIDAFTPIINLPQCAILGMGRIASQPVAQGMQIAVRDRMTLSLSFDHRIVDGAPAARFLQAVGALLENPSPWLLP